MKHLIAALSLAMLAACGSAGNVTDDIADNNTVSPASGIQSSHHAVVHDTDPYRERDRPWLSIKEDSGVRTINTPEVDHAAITIGEMRRARIIRADWNAELPDDYLMFPVNHGALRFAGPQADNVKDRMPGDERFILSPRHARLFNHALYRSAGQLFAGWRRIKIETRWAAANCVNYRQVYVDSARAWGEHSLAARIEAACARVTADTLDALKNPNQHMEPWIF